MASSSGLLKLAGDFKVELAGGDTAESPGGILADIVVLGSVPKGKAVLRSGARPGDRIYVTGELGASAATLDLLSQGKKLRPLDYGRHFYPTPRVAVGRVLREKGLASAMIDISDGLSTDLGHVCEESGVGAEIETDSIPLAGWANQGGALTSALRCTAGKTTSCCSPRRREKRFRLASRELLSARLA